MQQNIIKQIKNLDQIINNKTYELINKYSNINNNVLEKHNQFQITIQPLLNKKVDLQNQLYNMMPN